MGQDARLDLPSITFSQRGPIVETDQDAHVPWHATHSITEPKSVITRESYPKLVSHPLSHPLSFSLASSLHNGTEGAAAVSTAFSRTLSPDCPRKIGTRKRRSPSGIRLVFTSEGEKKVATGGGDVESEEKGKERERASFVERPPSDRSLPGNVQILIYRRRRVNSRATLTGGIGKWLSSIEATFHRFLLHEKIIMEKATRLKGLDNLWCRHRFLVSCCHFLLSFLQSFTNVAFLCHLYVVEFPLWQALHFGTEPITEQRYGCLIGQYHS